VEWRLTDNTIVTAGQPTQFVVTQTLQLPVFWDVMLCSLAHSYQRLKRTQFKGPFDPENEGVVQHFQKT
jgi:hypothetical protein